MFEQDLIRGPIKADAVCAGNIARTCRGYVAHFNMFGNHFLYLQCGPARGVLLSRMMLLFDEGSVFRKFREELGGKIGNSIEQIHTDREICPKNHCTITIENDLFDLVSLTGPSGRALDQRNTRGDTCFDVSSNRFCGGEVDRNLGTRKLAGKLRRGKISVVSV